MRLPNMLAYRVGRNAALLYAFMLIDSEGTGVCQSLIGSASQAGLGRDEWEPARDELVEEGLIETFIQKVPIAEIAGGYVYGNTISARLLEFEGGDRFGRLSAPKWAELRDSIFRRDDFTCQYCGERGGKLECDHVEPISRGGTNEPGNLVTACQKCNREKRSKLLEEWRRASV